MKKIELKCVYGNKQPGQVIELEDKKADALINDGAAILSIEEVVPSSKEIGVLKGQLTKAQNELEVVKTERDTLKTELDALKKGAK